MMLTYCSQTVAMKTAKITEQPSNYKEKQNDIARSKSLNQSLARP